MLPTFVVIGAMKAGTTTLWQYLDEHPQVFMCRPKEPNFFSVGWDKGLEWYEGLFAGAGDALARGEASTTYTRYPNMPQTVDRMADLVPDARLLYLVRDPIDRMRSHWLHLTYEGVETLPIEQALRESKGYLNRSRYGMQVAHFLSRYDREQLLVLQAESMYREPAGLMRRVFEFIGVDPTVGVSPAQAANSSTGRYELPRGVRSGVRVAAASRVYRAVPQPVRRLARSRMRQVRRAEPPDATISAGLRAELAAELAPDQALLRELLGDRLVA